MEKVIKLDYKAAQFVIAALNEQLAGWELQRRKGANEDELADLGNDATYVEILVSSLETQLKIKKI